VAKREGHVITTVQAIELTLLESLLLGYGPGHHKSSDVSGLAWAQSPGFGLALVGLGFGNPEPGPNSGLAKARGLAQAQARAYIPYIVIIADHFRRHSQRHWELKRVREISSGIVQIPLRYKMKSKEWSRLTQCDECGNRVQQMQAATNSRA
jgi:hypothetical protein